jgi:E3 SUMO-protein ligase PIAS1
MASNALDRGPLVARIKTLINTQLKAVLKRDGLPVSGAKAALQDRLITQVDNYIRRGDIVGFNRFSGLVSNPDAPERGLGPPSLSTPVSQPSYMLPTGRPPPSLGSGISSGTYSHGTSGLP